MKILVIDHSNKDYSPDHVNGAWQYLMLNFQKLGHQVYHVMKRDWLLYPFIYASFKPDVVISIGKLSGVITALHNKLKPNALFVHDLTDHPHFYPSEKRITFMLKNHDVNVTTSQHNKTTYNCDYLIANGSDFTPIEAEKKYDASYLGQIHSFYNIEQLQKDCKEANISLLLIHDQPTKEVPQLLAESKVTVLPINWDSSTKMCDYAAMALPTVAIKPNMAENIGFPAYYTENLAEGIKHLLNNPEEAKALGEEANEWFLNFSGNWETQAKRYIAVLEKHRK